MATRGESPIWETFGAPETILAEFEHWTVLLRPMQVTPGSMVLIANRTIHSMAELDRDEGAELGAVTAAIETALRTELGMEKINYLALMMVDAHLHFHVIPRYSGPVTVDGRTFTDTAWPGPPDLGSAVDDPALNEALRQAIRLA
ncbi:MAG: HIT family protein [Actinomycetota bacterium]